MEMVEIAKIPETIAYISETTVDLIYVNLETLMKEISWIFCEKYDEHI